MSAFAAVLLAATAGAGAAADDVLPFDRLAAHEVRLKPELEGVHPRVFVTAKELEALRERARTTHKADWAPVVSNLAAMKGDPPPAPGPQERRSQNVVAFAIAEISLAYAIEQKPEYLVAARKWVMTAIDYEPWGYTYYKPNVDLAAGHLLYAIGWSYDLLYHDYAEAERAKIRASLTRHAQLLYDYYKPVPSKRFAFTQNHTYIPTSGLAVTALALMGEAPEAPRWAALSRALHHRVGQCLSPDGYFFEGIEYWIVSTPWIVHFLDAWEHSTGESLWDRPFFGNWKYYFAHVILPGGRGVFDFGDVWEGSVTRAGKGDDYERVFPGGRMENNYNLLFRVAARLRDAETQAVAARASAAGFGAQEPYWNLLWRDDTLKPSTTPLPLGHHFEDSGAVFYRTAWADDATAFALRAGPPEGHRVTTLLPRMPEWELSDGHTHPDNGSFIIHARGRYLTGDSGYAGIPRSADHNTVTIGHVGQGTATGDHDPWKDMPYERLDRVRITEAVFDGQGARIATDSTAAYPDNAKLRRFTRTFTFDGQDAFRVVDRIETAEPKLVQWRLGSDTPIVKTKTGYELGDGPARLAVTVKAPKDASGTLGDLTVMAPGRPGSITEGEKKVRGHQLTLENAAPAAAVEFDVELRVRAP
jgi:hypothetical protein